MSQWSYQLTGDVWLVTNYNPNILQFTTPPCPTQLTVSALVVNKVYDGTTSADISSFKVNGISSSHPNVTVTGHAVFNNKNAGTNKTVHISYTLSGSDAQYYAAPPDQDVTGAITKKKLTATLSLDATKPYDGNATAAASITSWSGRVGSEAVNLAIASATFASKDAGSREITVVYALSGADAGNYDAPDTYKTAGTITQKTLTVAPPTFTANKTYDGTTAVGGTMAGALSGGLGDVAVMIQSATYAGKDAGTRAITIVYALTGAGAGNYVTPANYTSSGVISKRKLAIATPALASPNKVYDGTDAVLGTVTPGAVSNLVSGESVAVSVASSRYADEHAGTGKIITVTYSIPATGAAANYEAPDPGSVAGAITQKQLTAAAPTYTASKTYDGDNRLAGTTVINGLAGIVAADAGNASRASVAVADAGYADPNVATGKTVIITYKITGTQAGDYLPPADYTAHNGAVTRQIVTLAATVNGIANLQTSTAVTVTLSTGITALSLDHITVSGAASRGGSFTASSTVQNEYILTITNVTAEAPFTVSIAEVSPNIQIAGSPVTLTAHLGPELLSVTADGERDKYTTTALTLVFNKAIPASSAADIAVTAGGASRLDGAPSTSDGGYTWTVPVTEPARNGGTVTVAVVPSSAYSVSGSPREIAVHHGPVIELAQADGTAGEATTTSIGIVFDKPVTNLSTGNVTVASTSGGATVKAAGPLTHSPDYKIWYVPVVTYAEDVVTVTVSAPAGYTVSGSPVTGVAVHNGSNSPANYSFDLAGAVYNGAPHSIAVAPNTGAGAVTHVYYTGNSASATETPPVDAGNYTVSIDAAAGSSYSAVTGMILGVFTVSPRELTHNVAVVPSRIYDGTDGAAFTGGLTTGNPDPAVSIRGLIAGDAADVTLNAALHYVAGKNVKTAGAVMPTVWEIAGAKSGNYTLPAFAMQTAGIVPLQLSIGAPSYTAAKVYDGNSAVLGASPAALANAIAGDDIAPHVLSATYANRNAGGGKTVTVTFSIDGVDALNYTAPAAFAAIDGVITPKPLTIGLPALASAKTYDGTTAPAGSVTPGLLAGIEAIDAGRVTAVVNSAAYDDPDAGDRVITVTYALAGNEAANYTAPPPSVLAGTIAKRMLAVAFDESLYFVKEYDGTTAIALPLIPPHASLNRISPDDVDVTVAIAYATPDVSPVKAIEVTYGLTGAAAGNYLPPASYTAGNSGVITAKSLSITGIKASDRYYDGTTAVALDYSGAVISGNVPTDNDLGITVPIAAVTGYTATPYAAAARKPVTVPVEALRLAGDGAANYVLDIRPSDVDVLISPLPLEIFDPASFTKIYDGTTAVAEAFTSSELKDRLSNLIANDRSSVDLSVTASYDTPDAGDGKTVTLTYAIGGALAYNYVAPATAVGAGVITLRPLSVVFSPPLWFTKEYDGTTDIDQTQISLYTVVNRIAADDNDAAVNVQVYVEYSNPNVSPTKTVNITYSLSGTRQANYSAPGFELRTPAGAISYLSGLTVTGVVAIDREYDGTTLVELDYSAATLVPATSGLTIVPPPPGVFGQMDDAAAGEGKTVRVPVEALSLAGADADNYKLSALTVETTVNIAQKLATVTAENKSRIYGTPDPAFTFTYSGFVPGDNESVLTVLPTATTVAQLESPPGDYPITPAGAAANDYAFTYVDGTLTVVEYLPVNDWDNTDTARIAVSNSDFDGAYYVLWCGEESATVTVTPVNPYSTVSYGGVLAVNNKFDVAVPKPGLYPVTFTVTAPSGAQREYTVTLERRFSGLLSEKWGNLLVVDNVPEKNAGYKFIGYRWYRNGVAIPGAEKQYYSAGENDAVDKLGDVSKYYVEIMLADGSILRTCTVESHASPGIGSLHAYPNPVRRGEPVKITLPDTKTHDTPAQATEATSVITVYTADGKAVLRQTATGPVIELNLNVPAGVYIIRVNGQSIKMVVE